MPPFQRHEKIFEVWDEINSNEAIRIMNDHDLKPIWHQFSAEYEGEFEWTYRVEGPFD